MRLRHIEVINAIRVTGTLSSAAELLSLTQPAVSQILQSAERQLGYALFDRVKGRLAPTREALALFPEIERLDRQLETVRQLAENLRTGSHDGLRILAAPALAQTVVPAAVAALRRQRPSLRISIRADYSASALISLALLEADVAIVYHGTTHPTIRSEALGDSHFVVVGDPSVLPAAESMTLAELASRPLVGPDSSDDIGKLLSHALAEVGVELTMPTTARSYHSLLALVESSGEIGIVDAITSTTALKHGLRVVPIRPLIPIPVVASVNRSAPGSVLAEALIRECQRIVQGLSRDTPTTSHAPRPG